MASPTKVSISLLPAGTVLAIVFFVAKVTGYIDWSWWWVFAPLWVPLALAIVIIGFFFFMALVLAVISS